MSAHITGRQAADDGIRVLGTANKRRSLRERGSKDWGGTTLGGGHCWDPLGLVGFCWEFVEWCCNEFVEDCAALPCFNKSAFEHAL